MQVVWELRQKYNVSSLLKCADLPRATYYYWLKNRERPDKYVHIKTEIQNIYDENRKRFGYRRIELVLRKRGININHKTVLRLMREMGLFCRVRMKKYNSYRGSMSPTKVPNLLRRNFTASKPYEKWVTDITEFSLFGKKVYLSPILDLYNREIVSYSISHSPRFPMVVEMLENAFCIIPKDSHLILHSDQGWHYQMMVYHKMLEKKGVRQSMSRKGNCLDNAVMENFFGLLKSELLYLQDFSSIEHFKQELRDYIDYYNNKRIKAKLKGMSPVEYRLSCPWLPL